MKSFREYLREEKYNLEIIEPDAEKMIKGMTEIWKKYFPNGWAEAGFDTVLIPSLVIEVGVIGDGNFKPDLSVLPHRQKMNDPFGNGGFYIKPIQNVEGQYTMEVHRGFQVYRDPDPGSYLAQGKEKIPFRKTKGDVQKILTTFEKSAIKAKTVWVGTKNQQTQYTDPDSSYYIRNFDKYFK